MMELVPVTMFLDGCGVCIVLLLVFIDRCSIRLEYGKQIIVHCSMEQSRL